MKLPKIEGYQIRHRSLGVLQVPVEPDTINWFPGNPSLSPLYWEKEVENVLKVQTMLVDAYDFNPKDLSIERYDVVLSLQAFVYTQTCQFVITPPDESGGFSGYRRRRRLAPDSTIRADLET